MGYQRPVLRLKFQDPEMDGLEMTCRRPSVGQLEAYEGTEGKLDPQLEILVSCLLSWNLEDEEGNPVPMTLDGLKSQDQPFLISVLEAWMSQAVRVSAPLDVSLPSGELSPEVPIPMEPLSESLTN